MSTYRAQPYYRVLLTCSNGPTYRVLPRLLSKASNPLKHPILGDVFILANICRDIMCFHLVAVTPFERVFTLHGHMLLPVLLLFHLQRRQRALPLAPEVHQQWMLQCVAQRVALLLLHAPNYMHVDKLWGALIACRLIIEHLITHRLVIRRLITWERSMRGTRGTSTRNWKNVAEKWWLFTGPLLKIERK